MRLPPGLPITRTGAPSFITMVGAIEDRGRLPGASALAIGTPSRWVRKLKSVSSLFKRNPPTISREPNAFSIVVVIEAALPKAVHNGDVGRRGQFDTVVIGPHQRVIKLRRSGGNFGQSRLARQQSGPLGRDRSDQPNPHVGIGTKSLSAMYRPRSENASRDASPISRQLSGFSAPARQGRSCRASREFARPSAPRTTAGPCHRHRRLGRLRTPGGVL